MGYPETMKSTKTTTTKAPAKRGPGRPPVEDRQKMRGIRFNDAQWAEVQKRAKAAGMKPTRWVRSQCLPAP